MGLKKAGRKRKQDRSLEPPKGVSPPNLRAKWGEDFDTNIALFNAHLDPWPSQGEPKAIVGGDFDSEFYERDADLAYERGETPHVEFANLTQATPSKGALEALKFVEGWAPLKKSQVTYKYEEQVDPDLPPPLESVKFRVPLNDFWQEQEDFKELVSIWSDLSEGKRDYKRARRLVDALNSRLSQEGRSLEVSEKDDVIVGKTSRGMDLLTELYSCLWSDIVGKCIVRRCRNDLCQRFFRPSRKKQLYHDVSCLRRQHQREYMRAKRKKLKRKKKK